MGACLCESRCESVCNRGLGLPELVCGRVGKGGRALSLENELLDVKAVRDLGRLRFPSSASTLYASGSVCRIRRSAGPTRRYQHIWFDR
jgi:hypothetical protein